MLGQLWSGEEPAVNAPAQGPPAGPLSAPAAPLPLRQTGAGGGWETDGQSQPLL